MSLARVSLTSPPPTFVRAPGRVHRVSLAWWDPAEPEGHRDPVLVAGDHGGARTLVVVWPTDARGCIEVERVRCGDVAVLPWDLRFEDLERLRVLAESWQLDRHDLRVGERIWPTSSTLRTFPLGIDLDRKVRIAERMITEDQS